MFQTILREVSLAPFHLIDEFIEGFLYAHKKEEIETPQVRKSARKNKRLRMESTAGGHRCGARASVGEKTHSDQRDTDRPEKIGARGRS